MKQLYKRSKNVGLMLVILLLLYGCGKKDSGYTPTITSKDIYTGKEGLSIEFFESAPASEIFENSVLPIGLNLNNMGAYDIAEGYLSIGLEKDYMVVDEGSLKSISDKVDFREPEHIEFNLKGKTIEHPEGEHEVITFSADTKDLSKTDPQSEYHDSLIAITACYGYRTIVGETVCVDTDVYGFKKREKPCEIEALTLSSQGAPVAVTKIETEMLPDKDNPSVIKPRFVITVKNLGNGQVVKKSKVEEACSSEPVGYDEWNIVNVKAYISTIEEKNKLDCDITNGGTSDEGIMILKEKEDRIRCVYEDGFSEDKGAFASPLHIILDYGYTDTISRTVKIKKVIT